MRNMKKSALALAMFAAGGVAHAAGEIDIQATFTDSTAFAADDDTVSDPSGAVGLSSLLTSSAYSVDIGTGGDLAAGNERSIVYSPNTNIGAGSTITLTVTNGAVAEGGSVPALVHEDGAGGYSDYATMTDFTTNADGDYVTMRFSVETELEAGNGYILAYSDDGGNDVSVVADSGLSIGDSVTIEATSAQDASAIAISQGTAPAEDVITVVEPVTATKRYVTSTIDVEAANGSRTEFVVDEGDTGGVEDAEAETSLVVSRASFDLQLAAEINPNLATADYTLTLSRDNDDGVSAVNFDIAGGGAYSSGTAVPATATAGEYQLTGGDASVLADDAGITHNLDITTDKSEVLKSGAWSLDLAVDAGTGFSAFNIFSGEESHTWDINGAQVKIPYHAQNASGYNFFTKVVNESSNDATVYADVIVENVSQGTRESLSNVNIGTAVANGATTIGQAAIKTAIQNAGGSMNDSDVYHVAMTLTVIAPQNSVQVAAFQKDAVGRTIVPVYVNTNNTNDNRKWQQ